jgi:ferredoxin
MNDLAACFERSTDDRMTTPHRPASATHIGLLRRRVAHVLRLCAWIRATLVAGCRRTLGGEAVRIVVDLNRCQAYAQCAFLAPDVFTLHGEEALLYESRADEANGPDVLRAAAACPVQAILVDFGDRPATAEETDGHGR